MAFLLDDEEIQKGLIIFRRADVKHKRFYCRVKIPGTDRYKVVSLKTDDPKAARTAAFRYEIGLQTLIDNGHPVFNRLFSQIADDFVKTQKERAEVGQITQVRAENIESAVRTLNLKFGAQQVHSVTQADWNEYPIWRSKQKRRRVKKERTPKNGDGKPLKYKKNVEPPSSPPNPATVEKDKNWKVSDWTIRAEMSVLRSILVYAASKKFIAESAIPKGSLHSSDERREEFTREEYRALHSKGRAWITRATTESSRWYREIVYNFILVMCNTGMRPPEAKNLRWRDVTITTIRKETKGKENKNQEVAVGQDYAKVRAAEIAKKKEEDAKKLKDGQKPQEERKLVILNVRGKGKYRRLVAPEQVAEYLERIRAIAKKTGPDDYVFTTHNGKKNESLYAALIRKFLSDEKVNLLIGPQGSERTTYSFRHTYATLRLSEGVDVYLLAEQMGTSVQIIEDHYGHINPVKNADRVLMGMPVWEAPEGEEASETAVEGTTENARVNKGAAATKAAKANPSKRKPRK